MEEAVLPEGVLEPKPDPQYEAAMAAAMAAALQDIRRGSGELTQHLRAGVSASAIRCAFGLF